MVRRLIKHEFIYYIRTLSIFLPWVLFMGIITRVISAVNALFDKTILPLSMLLGSAQLMLILSCIALVMFCAALGIVRFYKNMYSQEGYLTFVLPVSNIQHVFVKLLTYSGMILISALISFVSIAIAFSGDPFRSVLEFVLEVSVFAEISPINIILYIFEGTVLLILSIISMSLLYYACISIGQLAKKNRILLAIGAYFAHNVIVQIIGSAFMILLAVIASSSIAGASPSVEISPYISIHLSMLAFIAIDAAAASLYLFITLYIMNKKLNLE